jgi:anti-sigma factor RsiW
MNHNTMLQKLSAYADNELESSDRNEVEEHLRGCPECRLALRVTLGVRHGIKQAADYQLPGSFAADVARSMRTRREEERSWLGVEVISRRLVFSLAVACAVIVGASALNQPEGVTQPERYFVGDSPDTSVTRSLLQQENISKEDVLLAAVID